MVTPPNYPTLGKTELAYAAAAQLVGDYPDGQILLELAGASATPLSPAQALQQVIRAFRPEDKLPEELPVLQLLYRSALAGRKVLILADDARDAAQVRSLLPPAGCALLITSRQRFALDGMAVVDLGRLDKAAAVVLLCGICSRLTEEQAQRLAQLCGFLPLALRVSAGILLNDEAQPVERYLNRLTDERWRMAHLKDPDDPDRDVQATLLLSYDALDTRTQVLFCRLGVLVADADLALIAALLELSVDQADEVLRTLLRRSLVEYDSARDRWGMHDLVRACALGLLIETGGERVARLRYAEQVIALIRQADRHYQTGGDGVLTGLALFDREHAHLDAVRAWLWSQPPAADIDVRVIEEATATIFIGDLRDALRTVHVPQLERALAAARRRGDRAAQGWILGHLGNSYRNLGEMHRAIELYEQRLAIARELGNRHSEGNALGNLGIAYARLGEVRWAIGLYEQDLAIARELGDRRSEGRALGSLGSAYASLGEVRQAIALYEQDLAITRELGDRRGEGWVLGNLGNAYLDLGEVRRAIALYEQHLVIAREMGDRAGEGIALGNLGNAYSDLGEVRRAITLYEQGLAITRGLGDRHGEGSALGNLGITFLLLGDGVQARSHCEAALALARDLGDRSLEGTALRDLANALVALEQPIEADICYSQSLAIHDELGNQGEAARTRWAYGQFLVRQGNRERGIDLMAACVAYEEGIGHARAAEHAALVERLRAGGAISSQGAQS